MVAATIKAAVADVTNLSATKAEDINTTIAATSLAA